MELTLHGVGHECWAPSPAGAWEFTRAEWHDRAGTMRPREEVLARIEYFQKLLDQHNLGEFPTSFVPCAFLHRFTGGAPEEENGLASLLKSAGVTFISTPFATMHGSERIGYRLFDFDAGLITVDRGRDLSPRWFTIGTPPDGELRGPICGMHWPNILHEDPERNEEVVAAWVQYLKEYDRRADRMLAPDTTSFATQLAHHVCTTFTTEPDGVMFDFSGFRELPQAHLQDRFTCKIASSVPLRFFSDALELVAIKEESTPSGTLYTLTLGNSKRLHAACLTWHQAVAA
jgi:hypothetical protein